MSVEGTKDLNLKQLAGEKAAEYVSDGMVVGLGTGSTTYYAIKKIGAILEEGLEIIGIPTSKQTERIARECRIPLSSLLEHPVIDVTIDGADEVDPNLDLIKGMGGALLREKIVANASKKEIIVIDPSKLVDKLGTKSPLPVEVSTFGWSKCKVELEGLGGKPVLRLRDNEPFLTDNSNFVIDCRFEGIEDPTWLESNINNILGVMENGLFLSLANLIIIGTESGVKFLERSSPS